MTLTLNSEKDVIKINKKMRMKKKFLRRKKEDDPEWMRRIACYFLTIEKENKSDEYMKELRELFLEYRRDGLEPNEAWRKAKKVLGCFGI